MADEDDSSHLFDSSTHWFLLLSHVSVFYTIGISNVKCVPAPVPDSEPGSVGDLCTKDRVPKNVHLSPPLPSFPPMSVLGLGLLSSGVVRKGVELSCNQLLDLPKAKQQVNCELLLAKCFLKIRLCLIFFFRNESGKQPRRTWSLPAAQRW